MPKNRILRIALLFIIFALAAVLGFFGGMWLAKTFPSHVFAIGVFLLLAAIAVAIYTIEVYVYGEE